jgi:hypothetical protein
MWGKHPKTGKPIRILQMETSVSKDQKTIVWIGPDTPEEEDDERIPWEKWEVGALSLAHLTPKTDILLLCSEDVTADVDWLLKNKWRDLTMILASKAVLDRLGDDQLKNLQIGNMICLEETAEIYPFIGTAWDGTQADAALIASILLRMNRVFGVGPSDKRSVHAQLIPPSPQKLLMITQYYKAEKARRAKEITTCLQKNIDNPLIDKIVLLNESKLDIPSSKKVTQEVVGERLKYSTVIRWIAEKAPANTLCVFANSDIYLDETWKNLWATTMEDRFLSLLRYEASENIADKDHVIFGPRADSQDTWVVLSDSVKAKKWDYDAIDFMFGKAGCDNAINVEMLRMKFVVANPALTLKTHHLHTSQIRNYDPNDIVDKPVYFYIQPTGLHDMTPIFNLKASHTLASLPFARPVVGANPVHLKTFCTMVAKSSTYSYTTDTPNLYKPEPISIYEADNVFQTPTGLAYTYSSLYVGKSKAASEAWNKSQISGLSPSLAVEIGLIAPLPDEYLKNSATYVLYYVAAILLLREKAGGGEFWSPRDKSFLKALQLFNWKKAEVPVLPRDDGLQVWAKKGYIMLPSDSPQITKHHVDTLRKNLLGGWKATSDTKTCVVFYDDLYCTREFINALEAILPEFYVKVIWPDAEVKSLVGAELILSAGGVTNWGWCWMAPKGAHIIQVQNEMEPDGECLHLAAAAELKHSLCICPKGKIQKGLLDQVLATLNMKPTASTNFSLPLLILPKQPSEAFFGHAGDSFREMAVMWAAKGYVRIVEDKFAHQVWLHGIGHTLLYDRPTYEWLEASPPEERKYKHGLFGNPAPPSDGKAWSFWPRRPSIVEELAVTSRPFADRTQTLVLYGKIENAVQKKRRPLNWASACSEFVMPVGGEKAYPFSQKEYLEKLGEAKFGLCLPGYGWKCHREVECMAMGCVPIVSPDVDMTNYAEPPVKGEHYFVAETPEEARRLAVETDEATWNKMSAACRAWWKENSSCDGMWRLTQKLTS